MLHHPVAGLAILLCVLQAPSHPSWRVQEAPADLRPAIQRAELIIVELQGALLAELGRALQASGETGALRSCHLDAIHVTQRIGRERGIAVGRTSDRLRSPTNAPRAWAAPIVSRFAGARYEGVNTYVVDLGDRIGVMRPIPTGRACLGCHGPADSLSAGVRRELGQSYPADRGVGFREGDLRGWFWVEIAKDGRTVQ